MKLKNCSEEGSKLDVLLLGSYLGGYWRIYHQLDNPTHEFEVWLNVIKHPGRYQTDSHSHNHGSRKTDHFGLLDIESYWTYLPWVVAILYRPMIAGGQLKVRRPVQSPRPCMRQSVRQVVLQCVQHGPIQIPLNLNIVEIDFQPLCGSTMWETNLLNRWGFAHGAINFACCEPWFL